MNKKTLNQEEVLELYLGNKDKGKYWVARELGLNKSTVTTIIDKKHPNSVKLDKNLENLLLEEIKKYPYTGTISKISRVLGVTSYKIRQTIIKSKNPLIKQHFNKPKSSTQKLTDQDIQDILEGSKQGIGNDMMGIIKNIDGVCIRNIRKKFLTEEEYKKYHSINRFYSGDYNSYYNNRGDKFLSTWEEKVADFLFKNKIEYFTNIRLSYKNKNYSPDIYIPENRVFIEIFGMSNVSSYIPNMNKKIEYYNKYKIKCLFLFEEDFLHKKEEINSYKNKLQNFLEEIKNIKFNNHIKDNNIIIN